MLRAARCARAAPARVFAVAPARHFSFDLDVDAEIASKNPRPMPSSAPSTPSAPSATSPSISSTPSAPSPSILSTPSLATSTPETLLDDIFADLGFDTDLGTTELDDLFAPDATTNAEPSLGQSAPAAVVTEEQNLFQKIFETYSRSESVPQRNDRLEKAVLSNLQQSFTAATTAPPAAPVLSRSVVKEIVGNVRTALSPTLDLLDSTHAKLDLVEFLRHTVARFHTTPRTSNDFYMYKAKAETNKEYEARCERMCASIDRGCAENAREPVLNVFTLPILFNHVLHVLGHRLFDGQLAISLFHAFKKNLDLYTVVCNQQTYNEIIKIYWVYMGKASLCEVELVFLEMQNNGFAGDLSTFSILKEILATYHSMRLGKTMYNPGGVPIWCQEDERRAKNLGNKLRALGRSLRNGPVA